MSEFGTGSTGTYPSGCDQKPVFKSGHRMQRITVSLRLGKITSLLTYSVFWVVFVDFFLTRLFCFGYGDAYGAGEGLDSSSEADGTGWLAVFLCLIGLFQFKEISDSAPFLPSALLSNSHILTTL